MVAWLRSRSCRIAASGCAIALTLTLLAVPTSAADAIKVILGVSWPPYSLWTLIKEHNLAPDLDIEVIQMDDPLQAHALLAAGKADVLMSTIDYTPIIVEQNLPIKLVAFSNLDYGSSQILVGPGIETAADVRGKKVGALDGYISQLMMVLWLEQGGVGADEVEWVNLSPEEAAAGMMGGDVVAAYTWDPWAGQILANLPGSKSIANAKETFWLETSLLADSMFMNASFVNEKRDVALQAMRAYYDGLAWWRKNTAEGNARIAETLQYPVEDVNWVLGADGTSLDGALRMYDFIEAARYCGVAPGDPPHGQRNGHIWRVFTLTNENWMKVGLNSKVVPAARAVDCSLLRELYETGYAGEPDPNY